MDNKLTDNLVKQIIKEDFCLKDITTQTLVHPGHISTARIMARQNAVICGLEIAKKIFRQMDRKIFFKSKITDGKKIKKGGCVLVLKGHTRSILSAERAALNVLGYLSGIATLTRQYVEAVRPSNASILDTRKTTPTLRWLERYAVRCGGGTSHRDNLSEMAMIKDNHLAVSLPCVSIAESIRRLKKISHKKIIVEVEDLDQLAEALLAAPQVILLDNMPVPMIKKAVLIRNRLNKKVLLEASGGVNLKTVRAVARTGVERISVGALTHSAPSADLSLEMAP